MNADNSQSDGFGIGRPHNAERHLFAPPDCNDVGTHQLIEDILADSQEKGELSTPQNPVPSSLEALTKSSEQDSSVMHTPDAVDYSESKKAISDKFVELGQLLHKQETNHQSEITNGQMEILDRISQLEREITHHFSDLLAQQNESAETANLVEAQTKQFHADLVKQNQGQHSELMQQFLRQEKHVQHNHIQTMKAREQHHKEMLSKKETNEREEKRRFEESIRSRDQSHAELIAILERQRAEAQRQYEDIKRQQLELLTEIKAVQLSLVGSKKSAETTLG